MIDIIGHFFVLYPWFTFVKESTSFTKSSILKFVVNLTILALAAGLTNVYLMDSELVQGGNRRENLYEIMEMNP